MKFHTIFVFTLFATLAIINNTTAATASPRSDRQKKHAKTTWSISIPPELEAYADKIAAILQKYIYTEENADNQPRFNNNISKAILQCYPQKKPNSDGYDWSAVSNGQNWTAIEEAFLEDIQDPLLKNKTTDAYVNLIKKAALFQAAYNDQGSVIEYLANVHTDLSVTDDLGTSAFVIANGCGSEAAVKKFLEYKKRIDNILQRFA